MPTITWVESVPSNASRVGNAPVDFRSVWTAVTTGLSVEHFWPGSGGASEASAGELRPGASRAFSGNRSASSAPNSQMTGRLFLDRDNSRLYAYDSAGTYLVGTSWYGEDATGTQGGGYFLRTAGAIPGISTGSGVTTISFGVTYVTYPTVCVTSSSASWMMCAVSNFSTLPSAFTSVFSSYAGASSTATMYWEACGVVSFASV